MGGTRTHEFVPSFNIIRMHVANYISTHIELSAIKRLGIMIVYGFNIVVPTFGNHGLMVRQQIPQLLTRGQTVKRIIRLAASGIRAT